MSEENKKSKNQVEAKLPSRRVEQKPKCGYWIVCGMVCWTRQQMIEAVTAFRDSAGR